MAAGGVSISSARHSRPTRQFMPYGRSADPPGEVRLGTDKPTTIGNGGPFPSTKDRRDRITLTKKVESVT